MKKLISQLTLFSLACGGFAFADKPNIICILIDDLGYADVSFQEVVAEDVHTPNIDRLADSGVVFSEAYASSAVCSTSRLGFSTGRYQTRWGAYWYGQGGLPYRNKPLQNCCETRVTKR